MKTILTHTGKIYVDTEHKLEFLTVGDYGKENNIKANFLGLTKEINGVENTAVDLSKKWVATISTQKGCPMHCKFCDVPKFGFYGNASIEDMDRQIRTIIEGESVRETDRFNVHFARMGEPTWNDNVLAFGLALRGVVKSAGLIAKTVHPVVSTMLPKANNKLRNFLQVWCSIKNEFYNGEIASEKIIDGRIVFVEEENPIIELLAAKFKFHNYITPSLPMKELISVIELDPSGYSKLFS